MFTCADIRVDEESGRISLNDLLVSKCGVQRKQAVNHVKSAKLREFQDAIRSLRINGVGRATPCIPKELAPRVMAKYIPAGAEGDKFINDLIAEFGMVDVPQDQNQIAPMPDGELAVTEVPHDVRPALLHHPIESDNEDDGVVADAVAVVDAMADDDDVDRMVLVGSDARGNGMECIVHSLAKVAPMELGKFDRVLTMMKMQENMNQSEHTRRLKEQRILADKKMKEQKRLEEMAVRKEAREMRRLLALQCAKSDPELLYKLAGMPTPAERAAAVAGPTRANQAAQDIIAARDAEIALKDAHIAAITSVNPMSRRVRAAADEHILGRPVSTVQVIGNQTFRRHRGEPLVVEETKIPDDDVDSESVGTDDSFELLSDVPMYYDSREHMNSEVFNVDEAASCAQRSFLHRLRAFVQSYYHINAEELNLHQKQRHVLMKGTILSADNVKKLLKSHVKMQYRVCGTARGDKPKYEFAIDAYNAGGLKFHEEFELVFHVTQKKRKGRHGSTTATRFWRVTVCLHPTY